MVTMIRPYREGDAGFLAPIHTAAFPDDPLSAAAFGSYVASMIAYGATAWVIAQGSPFGYALSVPVPGLPHIADLKGCIAPSRQGNGFGSRLLRRVLAELQPTAVRQVAYQVSKLESPAAQFLLKNGFYVEHEEWMMFCDDLRRLPQLHDKDEVRIITQPRSDAVSGFLRLFAAAFSGLPWDQPFSSPEVAEMLDDPADMLFLMADSRIVGFAWLHLQADGLGVIEPLGILPDYQQQGHGRYLLLSALHELVRRGASRARIGAWRTNRPAVHLYQSVGFVHRETITFLAYDLNS